MDQNKRKLIIHAITEHFPTPTAGELSQPPLHYIAINDYWWKIVKLHIDMLAQSHLWDDLSDEIEQAILKLTEEIEMHEYIGANVYNSADLGMVAGDGYLVPFDSEEHDTGNFHDLVTENWKFVAPMDGKYQVYLDCYAYYAGVIDGVLYLYVHKNGAIYISQVAGYGNNGVFSVARAGVSQVIELAAGDAIQFASIQLNTSNATASLIGGANGYHGGIWKVD